MSKVLGLLSLGFFVYTKYDINYEELDKWLAESARDWEVLGSIPDTSKLFHENVPIKNYSV